MSNRHLIIATRESPLALKQAQLVKDSLLNIHPHLSIEYLGITTQADKQLDITLNKVGGKGLFVKELEEALLAKRADLAVHSMKDVPVTLPSGLILPVMTEREDARDVFISKYFPSLMACPLGARVGTSSLRRQLQIQTLRPDLKLINLRGNIQTRLRRLAEGDYDAIILASAGLHRMGLQSEIRSYFSVETLLPSAGQGALGLECSEDNEAMLDLIRPLNHLPTQLCVSAERAFTRCLGGGCTAPVAAFAHICDDILHLKGLVIGEKGSRRLLAEHSVKLANDQAKQADELGVALAKTLIEQGAFDVLKEFQ